MKLPLTQNELPETTIHDILRNSRRQNVIKHLLMKERRVALRDLAERLAEKETGESPPPRNIRDSVYISLHQTHLPKLDQAGILDYDQDRKTVVLRNTAREVDRYMNLSTRFGVTWEGYYRSLATTGLCLVLLSHVGVPLVSMVDGLLWTALFLVLLALSVVYQLWARRRVYVNRVLRTTQRA